MRFMEAKFTTLIFITSVGCTIPLIFGGKIPLERTGAATNEVYNSWPRLWTYTEHGSNAKLQPAKRFIMTDDGNKGIDSALIEISTSINHL